MTCAILGDSIAVSLHYAATHCDKHARVGITSAQFMNEYVQEINADVTIISIGANDIRVSEFAELNHLRVIRSRVKSPNVVWLLPLCDEVVNVSIRTVALEYGDKIVDLKLYSQQLHLSRAANAKLAGDLKL